MVDGKPRTRFYIVTSGGFSRAPMLHISKHHLPKDKQLKGKASACGKLSYGLVPTDEQLVLGYVCMVCTMMLKQAEE